MGLSPYNFDPKEFAKIYLLNPLFKKNITFLVFDDKENTSYALDNNWISRFHDHLLKRMK